MPAASSLRRSANRGSASKPSKQEGLRQLVQHRILTDVFDSCMKMWSGWSVLVMDSDATRVISSAVGMYDIMERKVMTVEDLEKKRAPYQDKAVIYLLAPSEHSVDLMLQDYQDKPLYGQAAFVFFLGRCPDRLISRIKECKPLLKKIKKLAEVNVDFLAKEMRAFHLDMRSSFKSIYGGKRSKVEHAIADKLLTVCATLNEYPHIRYPEDSRFCQALAKSFHSKMDTFLRNNSDFWYHGDGQHTDRDRATLLLLDRRDDCLSPLMHEFTYQALVNDLLPIEEDRITIDVEAATKDDDAKQVKQDFLLNENDELWVELRSKHIADVGQILSNRIREIINSDTSQVSKRDKGQVMSVEQMSKALRALPEYREVMSKLSEHLRLSQLCWDKLKERELVDLSQLEQTLATGKDDDGRSPKLEEMINRVEEELRKLKDTVLKMRLIMILIVSQGGIKEQYKNRVWRAANLKGSAERVIMKLEIMGIPIISTDQSTRGLKLFGGKRIKASGAIDEETEYNSRYVPPLQPILEDLVNNQLSIEEYPSLMPMPEMGMTGSGTATSARKRDGSASARKSGTTTSRWQKPQEKPKAGLFTGGRAIVFYVGGICFSELRVARTVMERENKEIVVGSTHFTKPKDFLRDMDKLSNSSSSSGH